jgi:hypothetical protein
MTETITFGLLCFTSFFTLINPLGTMPIFMTMTADLTVKDNNYKQVPAKFNPKQLCIHIGIININKYFKCLVYIPNRMENRLFAVPKN